MPHHQERSGYATAWRGSRGRRSRFSVVVQLKSALAQILTTITVPQVFFVLHPAEAQNRSLKGAKLAIILYSRSFVYIYTHACAMTFYDAISGKL